MYNDIADKLATIISGITGIQAVYKYGAKEYPLYPCAVIMPKTRNSDYKTLGGDNERHYEFVIQLITKLEDYEQDQLELRDFASSLDDLLESKDNISLGGTVNFTELSEGSFSFPTNSATPIFVYETVYKASALFQR